MASLSVTRIIPLLAGDPISRLQWYFTIKCGWIQHLLIVHAYEDKKRKCGSLDQAEHFLSNGEVFSLQTNFHTELEQSFCSTSAALARIWDNRSNNQYNSFQKFVFPHHRCYGTQNLFGKSARLEILT